MWPDVEGPLIRSYLYIYKNCEADCSLIRSNTVCDYVYTTVFSEQSEYQNNFVFCDVCYSKPTVISPLCVTKS